MSKVFACPYCGKTNEEVTFKVAEEMPVYYDIEPYIHELGFISFHYSETAKAEPDWEAAEVPDVPYIRCPACDEHFVLNEFVVKESAVSTGM